MVDETEEVRRALQGAINMDQRTREEMEALYGQCWDTQELGRDFEVLSFLAPFVEVRRKSDGVAGAMVFRHAPRLYFGFKPLAE